MDPSFELDTAASTVFWKVHDSHPSNIQESILFHAVLASIYKTTIV